MYEKIKKLGLDETEAKVYWALLELGPSTVTEIAKKAGITRTLGYPVIDKLNYHGLIDLVSSIGKKKLFVAQHPNSLVQFVKRKEQLWVKRTEEARSLLPDLLSLYKIADKPVVRYQEGVRGLITLFEESLESTTEILSILDVDSWQAPDLWEWAKGYNRERNRRKIKERILILDTPAGRAWIKKIYKIPVHTTYRWIKRDQISDLLQFGGELNVYENRVMIALLEKGKRMGVIIESLVLANILKAMYELVWRIAIPVRK
jgi:sugar-specific transcriptional regulator TrmB